MFQKAGVQNPTKQIDHIQFSLMKGSETEKISAVSINHHFLYGENSQEPNIGGPLDKRLGTSLRTRLCETCG
jgi:hypothetical protein